ncbi:MAG: hypothetical protein COZ16_00915 [Flavobacteriaceae bacterium CG_4_10_14_3_um_filter_31_253]|nr:MAG: hypothetical protein AUK46_07810 [Flavobacteriaceae bacterium CG2_30_31_66]PIV95783.1 MAG: hypothetical protein COW43_11645 [Flavobacteriaceae bacterium CG17_big_fil_post_rev_8_21_14_2_50_31_13]PIX13538.1 MAG: hypothetical protein COZ74_05670 [Flavobacteriaceae bacterium CG_4_8_14_3_um_filter_31_8]PIY16148.1 MAG: hypothetical protein COZ16_00915 [Flavobacteriaceae bacterium CG_4_10_14_3_um_filter_31_253]PIZ11299.1 MAG: hypothetical protein COY55_05295 [Flavobacteriaceae bacterium CG_4_1
MIKFFRKIRQKLIEQQKVRSYFLYAIGEIILVVIGILIALQINNWNEIRKLNKTEKEFLSNIYNDLVIDSTQFTYYLETFKSVEKLHFQLYQIGINNEVLDSINEPALIRRSLYFKQLIDKDFKENAFSISNTKVRKELITYTKLVADMETSYTQELEQIISDDIRPFLGKHKLYNTKNLFKLKDKYFNDYTFKIVNGLNLVDKNKLIALSKTEEFQQILFEINLKWNEFHSRLLPVIEENNKLKNLIKQELKNY